MNVTFVLVHTDVAEALKSAIGAQVTADVLLTPVANKLAADQRLFRLEAFEFNAACMRVFWPLVNILAQVE